MKQQEIDRAVRDITKEKDPCLKHLTLASLLGKLFKEKGFSFIVVGGSAIEILTDGAYQSGDLDICWDNVRRPSLKLCQEIMGKLGAKGGPRSWEVCGTFVDTLGIVETDARTSFRKIKGAYGTVSVAKPEDLIVERVLVANYPQKNDEAKSTAKKLLAVCLTGTLSIDWNEVERVAGLSSYGVSKELKALKKEAADEAKKN